MKKNLIALAVAGAFVAPVAMADVTIYGIANISYDQTKNGSAGASTGVTNNKISSNASRLGFKGSEDLGGGLSAVWQIESTIGLDSSASTLANRATWAGLSSKEMGTLSAGRHETAYKMATRGYDVFSDGIADNRNIMGGGGASSTVAAAQGANAYMAFDARQPDTVRYDSPNINGFTVAATYTASSETNTSSALDTKGRGESLSANYASGPMTLAAAYEKHVFGYAVENMGQVAAGKTDEKAWKVGGSYTMNQFGVNAVYEKTTDSFGSTAGGLGHKAYYLAGTMMATANDKLKLSYTKVGDLKDGTATSTGAKQWAVGVDHAMSKRTTVYALYTKLSNDANALYGLSISGATSGSTAARTADADPSAISIGMKHTF
jgi:predicted porin